MKPYRPSITGTRHMISAGHHGAAHAGFCILEAGGNAVDAGVAAGICLQVLQSDLVNFAGVAPIMLWLAERREVVNIDGLGVWPRAARVDVFHERYGGRMPPFTTRNSGSKPMKPYRPSITGTRHMISAGHHGAAHAGFCILEAGGNAVDAGVAAGMCLQVLQSDLVNFAGVAPIMLWLAERREVVNIDGLGVWPRATRI